jgi:hypothetical protein
MDKPIVMQAKPWFQSKALWFNVGIGVATAVMTVATSPDSGIPQNIVLLVGVVGNLIIRLLTKGPLTR